MPTITAADYGSIPGLLRKIKHLTVNTVRGVKHMLTAVTTLKVLAR